MRRRASYNFPQNATALLNAAATRNLKMLRLTARKAVQTSDVNNLRHLTTLLATCVRDVLGPAGGGERLMSTPRLHHAHVQGHLNHRHTKRVVSPAALAAAPAANGQWGRHISSSAVSGKGFPTRHPCCCRRGCR